MAEKLRKKYEHKEKYNAVEDLIKRNDISFKHANDARVYKKDNNFVKLCEVLEGISDSDEIDNLFIRRLEYLRDPRDERITKKFKDAHRFQDGSNMYGSRPLQYLDGGLNACGLIDDIGQLTERGRRLITTLSSLEQ